MKETRTSLTERMHPVTFLLIGYIILMVLGSVLLSLPFSQTREVPVIDNIFTSASAISTTGLVTKNISEDYNIVGQVVILVMIQFGGIGYMSIASFVILGKGQKFESGQVRVLKTDLHLPNYYRIDDFVRKVILFSIIVETIGTAALYPRFAEYGLMKGVWYAMFHSISAFCTAGFSLNNDNLIGYQNDYAMNYIISALCLFGAIGFIVFSDFYDYLLGRKPKITYTSEIILKFTALFVVMGSVLVFLLEPSIRGMSPELRLTTAFFHTTSAMTTAGMNTISMGVLAKSTLFVLIILMIIGASPSGTGGGLRNTTITAVLAQMKSTLKGEKDAILLKRIIPTRRVHLAQASFTFYFIFLALGVFLLLLTESFDFESLFFEVASAMGNVGLSVGLTPSLTVLGKLIVSALMMVGRIGPLSIGIVIFKPNEEVVQEEDVAL